MPIETETPISFAILSTASKPKRFQPDPDRGGRKSPEIQAPSFRRPAAMEGESAAAPTRRWAENVIVLSSGRPPRSEEAAVVAGQGQHQRTDAPPEKLYYKTRLCDKYEATGRCVYEDGCTFAHGRAELRPPVPPHAHAVWRRPPDQEHGGRIVYGGGKAWHNFRDRGHFGDKLAFPHAAAPAPPGHAIRITGDQKLLADERRSATPPAMPSPAPRYTAPGPARAFAPVPAPAARDRLGQIPVEDGGKKSNRLMLMSLRKTSGIYGDWPEQF
uniref:C3H1-type domain-containing protein n=2 Tax=Triticum urartu TaxID=4572 RepID=A0A8R7PQR6_TRIUA